MSLSDFYQMFYDNLMASTWLEIIAVIFGIASVWFARTANIMVFPTGLISTVIYIYICFFAQLYADMGINLFYTGMSLYGWYMWTRKDADSKMRPIRWNTKKEQALGIMMIPILYVIIFGLLFVFNQDNQEYMQSYVPYIDSFTTSIFLIGMWYMARKKIENWIYWIAGNLISIPLYFVKGLVFTSFQFTIFLVLAVMGLMEWKRMYDEGKVRQKTNDPALVSTLEGQV